MSIKGIIFDLGQVLIDFNHHRAAERISKFTDKNEQEIFNLFFDSEVTGKFEEGRISPLQFFLRIKKTLNLQLDFDGFVPIWNEVFFFTGKNLAVYNLAYSLKNRYQVMLLSNINILHFEYIKKTFPVLDAFHNIVTSFESGVRKPQKEIYQKALKILGLPPGDVFYTDDRGELVESANQLGIRSFIFQGIDQLKNDLSETGIDIR